MIPETTAQVAALIQMTLVPVIMISAVGLICLVVQNRHGLVVDRIYRLNRERLRLRDQMAESRDEARAADLGRQLAQVSQMSHLWLQRGSNTRNALGAAFLGILLFGLTSLWLVLGALLGAPGPWHAFAVVLFVAGIGAFLASFAFVLVDLQQSLTLSRLDTEYVDRELARADGRSGEPRSAERLPRDR